MPKPNSRSLLNRIAARLRSANERLRRWAATSSFAIPGRAQVECNICQWRGRRFADYDCGFGHIYPQAACPRCGAHPRHRSLQLFLQQAIPRGKPQRVLHFAPEPALTRLLQSFANVDYLSVDIHPGAAMQQEDITQLSFPAESFDVIVCIHVLEHVEKDRQAMGELWRVLQRDGVAILDVPIDYHREITYEDPSIRSPEARTREFWQSDHVRLYGRDFGRRLSEAGFQVTEDPFIASLGAEVMRFHGLQSSPLFLCRRGE